MAISNTGNITKTLNKKKKETGKSKSSGNSNKPLSSASALKNYNKVQSQKPSGFKYNDKQLKKLYDNAMNRKDFSFDLNGNAFYNQYKDKFTKQGQLAMADTVGQVAAASGGYGNSYAQTAGQQIYQQNLDNLTDIVPELYNLAFQQYQYEGQQLQDKYAMATGERDFAYGKYRDDVSDWQYNNDTAYNIYADTRDYEYQQSRDKVADSQWQKTFDEGKRQFGLNYNLEKDKFAETKNQNAIQNQQWNQTFAENQRQFNLNYDLDVDKFNETKNQNAIANQQWQQTFDRGVYESDRDYNRGVYESDRDFGESQRQFNESLAFDKQRQADSNSQWNKSYNLSQQELSETIRHNIANESYNTKSLGLDSENPFGDDTGSSGGTEDFDPKKIKATSSYEHLSKQSKQLYDQAILRGYDIKGENGVVMKIYDGIENGSISKEDAMWLFNSFGYDPTTGRFKN